MRFLVGVLLFLLASAAPGQEARLTLEDGSTMQGVLVEVGEQRVQLRVAGRVVTVPIARIVDFTEVDPGAAPPPVGGPVIPSDVPGPGASGEPQGTEPPITAPGSGPESLFASRLGWISQRYTWIPTDDTKTVASVGMIFLLLLASMFHFASSVTRMEAAAFQRALVLAVVTVAAAAAQIGFVPSTPVAVLCAAGGSLVGWFVVSRVIYEARIIDSLWLVLALAVTCLVSLVIFEVLSGVMGMLDEGGTRDWNS